MNKHALLIILDSVGCGKAPDAANYGDEGANTLGNLFSRMEDFELPVLGSLGLYEILALKNLGVGNRREHAMAMRLTEKSVGKDTTTGHWELMGCVTKEPLFTCESFPRDFVSKLEVQVDTRFLGNRRASGTEILVELGEEHLKTGHPILYTSADSVLQIAAHEEIFGLERLYMVCEKARKLLDQEGFPVGRVIARPFLGDSADTFKRTSNRHDYSLKPGRTVLNELEEKGVEVVGIGKIHDIFAGSGISRSIPTQSNREGMDKIDECWKKEGAGERLYFANLVDFDSLYGHRRDPKGYAVCLREFDQWLGEFVERIGPEDLVIVTADHGNDPYHHGTDHTREQVPCIIIGATDKIPKDLADFSDVARCLARFFR